MAFINQRLPVEVEIGAVRLDEDDIEIVETDGGFEHRNARASQSLLTFELAYPTSKRNAANYLAVRAMFKAARQSLHSFRFRDFTEYQLDAEVIGTGDGATTAFQISKSYTAGAETHVRTITRPVSGTLSIYLAGVLQAFGFSVDYTTGIVIFTSPPGVGVAVAVSGEFDVPVRFDGPLRIVGTTPELDHLEGVTLKEVRE